MTNLTVFKKNLSDNPLAVPAVRVACFVKSGCDFSQVTTILQDYLSLIPKDIHLQHAFFDDDDECELLKVDEEFLPRFQEQYEQLKDLDEENDFSLYAAVPVELGASGFSIDATLALTPDEDFPNWRDSLFFDFSYEFAQSNLQAVVQFTKKIADRFPTCNLTTSASLNAAFSLNRMLFEETNVLLLDNIALDASYEGTQYYIGNKILQPAWLTYLNQQSLDILGGEGTIRNEFPDSTLLQAGNGFLLRAAQSPPVGNLKQGAKDVGLLPQMNRFLKPVISQNPDAFRRFEKQQFENWLNRFSGISITE